MMLEKIAIRTVWGKAWDALRRIPWFVWVALAVLALWWIDRSGQYREGRADGREAVMAELRAAEQAAGKRALKAAAKADEKAAKREEAQAKVIADQIKAIEAAEADDENALDALF